MNWFFKDSEKKFNLKEVASQKVMYRVMPRLFAEIMTKYFRMTVEGVEHLPRRGPAIIIPNHSGYSGLDAFLLGHHIKKATKRKPRILTHKLWFAHPSIGLPMKKLGFIEATKKNGIKSLEKNKLVVLFPEGENGNFKPSNKAYHLQEFKRGFIRMAITKQCPIIPTLILGAEETHINLAKLKLTKYLPGTVVPLPLNIIPLPARWHIIFMEPIYLPYSEKQLQDRELINDLATDIREKMQTRLSQEVNKRKNLYF